VNRYYLAAGVLFIAIGAALVAGKFLAFDAIMAFIVRTLSRDQIIDADNEVFLARSWSAAATATLLLGGLLSACSIDTVRGAFVQWIGRDALAWPIPRSRVPRQCCCGHRYAGWRW